MSQYENDNPYQVSNEALLRFLNAAPSVRRGKQRHAPERSGIESDAQNRHLTGQCPSSKIYLRVFLGTAEQEEAEKALSHAATCESCGDLLAASLISLDGAPSAEEAAAISQLAATKFPWQTTLARELAGTKAQKQPLQQKLAFLFPGPGTGRRSGRGWLVAAGVAATLVAGVALFVLQRRASAPEHLLAMAYAQSRTLELRIPEGNYSAVVSGTHTRGTAANNEPVPLLEARAGLARKLEASPQDTHWLELQARADVLGERYDSATDVLDRLIAVGPVTAELLTDAAAAYFQRGLVSGSELDRSTALDYLRRADELAPTDPVILFNEAIVMEDRGQMMNAVEVWNRFITVERDERWAAEGRRKLAALEQTLNRLKSHQSRMRQLLASPEAMNALVGDAKRLASLDEELSSYELDVLLKSAFPAPVDGTAVSGTIGQARGSPCVSLCQAARKLLKATAVSLETRHHDFWLSDLLPPDIDSLPAATHFQLSQAMQLLAQATREDQTGDAAAGARMASQAQTLFQRLKGDAGAYRTDISLSATARAGDERASVEYMFALQQQVDFRDCRVFAEQLRTQSEFEQESRRYPWIAAQELVTEKVCDDTPETRVTGRALQQESLRLAEAAGYPLLIARIRMREAGSAQNAGDGETTEQLTLATFRELITGDPPPLRVIGIIGALPYVEQDSPRAHVAELSLRESVAWLELADAPTRGAEVRMELARAEMRIGAMTEAENQLRHAYAEGSPSGLGKSKGANFSESEILLAESMLERGDRERAARFLNQAAAYMANNSDTWLRRRYASVQGQLALSRGHYDVAAQTLESDIRSSEGKDVRGGDRATAAEFAQQDHDLYAELAATWLAQGRSPESVLALWERFRLRSRGLPIAQCREGSLDCEQPLLLAEQHRLGNSLLIGQVMLLDRVLIYRVDRNTVSWSEKAVRRQDILDAAQTLERAVSSPYSSSETVAKLGTNLSNALLPQLPASLNPDASLLLEQDPKLQNLPWPVLPTQTGSLGLQYPLAEVRSILATAPNRDDRLDSSIRHGGPALVVGASMAGEGEPPLPEAMKEADSVNAFLHSPDLLLGQQATTSHVASAIGSATIFHFAGHALQTGSGTELLLAAATPGEKSPWIDGEFLRRHPPRACRLAVLSACATGVREAAWNHPLQDIIETLGSQGVPEIVATRWRIDSTAAIPFMDAFYQSLAQGTSVAVALTSARRVESEKSLYASPYYWGAYYATGRETTRLMGEFHANIEKQAKGKEKHF